MDIFTRFNRKSIDDRQIDTLVGLSKGLAADGEINQLESDALLTWLIQSRQISDSPVIVNLLSKVSAFLEDGVLDGDESTELLALLQQINGDQSEIGELAKATGLPLDEPFPNISFEKRTFLFTGTCAYGTRKQCQAAIESLGASNASGVTKGLNYLVLGTYVTDSWAHETYGRKIEKAMSYRSDGVPIAIVSESRWIKCGGLQVRRITMRPSKIHFAPPGTWQKELALLPDPLRGSAQLRRSAALIPRISESLA